MNKKLILTVIITAIVTGSSTFLITMISLDSSGLPEGYESISIQSEILNESRDIIVSLPESYSLSDSAVYPVLYILGGNSLTFEASYASNLMTRINSIPELIIVGLPNIDQKSRQRNLTPPGMRQDIDELDSPEGQADLYLEYIEKEVIPLVGSRYRTNSIKILAGHSREGLCAFYSIMLKPELFDARLIFSPALWRENNAIVERFREFYTDQDTLDLSIYMSLGKLENEKMTDAFKYATDVLENHTTQQLEWQSEFIENAHHGNNAYLSIPVALKWFFDSE